ncbi:CBU_0592 family membrane protein [Sulfurospirillum sp. 1612]|uniref:CBU_0592 family membrane protein n=1 Tax=Sulfurospirillum sp. 1612 TaxID=3094835 RepID=UPI002F9256CB
MDIYQWIGFIGMIFIVYAYFLLQTNQVTNSSTRFQLLNLSGATLLIISLIVHFNLGSFLIEVFWIMITLYGIMKNYKKSKGSTK